MIISCSGVLGLVGFLLIGFLGLNGLGFGIGLNTGDGDTGNSSIASSSSAISSSTIGSGITGSAASIPNIKLYV